MTDEQINRTIAESLEPEPRMDAKCWTLRWPMYGTTGILPKLWRQPRNFRADPAMRDLLQAKLLEEGWFITMHHPAGKPLWMQLVKGEVGFDIYDDTRERIWALAFIRAHNLGDAK